LHSSPLDANLLNFFRPLLREMLMQWRTAKIYLHCCCSAAAGAAAHGGVVAAMVTCVIDVDMLTPGFARRKWLLTRRTWPTWRQPSRRHIFQPRRHVCRRVRYVMQGALSLYLISEPASMPCCALFLCRLISRRRWCSDYGKQLTSSNRASTSRRMFRISQCSHALSCRWHYPCRCDNTNANTPDIAYGFVSVTRFVNVERHQETIQTLRPSQPTCAVSASMGCYHLHPP